MEYQRGGRAIPWNIRRERGETQEYQKGGRRERRARELLQEVHVALRLLDLGLAVTRKRGAWCEGKRGNGGESRATCGVQYAAEGALCEQRWRGHYSARHDSSQPGVCFVNWTDNDGLETNGGVPAVTRLRTRGGSRGRVDEEDR